MPYPNYHAMRLRPPGIFAKGSFRSTHGGSLFGGKLKVPSSILLIWGKLKGKSAPSDPPILQAIRFDKSQWSPAAAKSWYSKHFKRKGISFEPAAKAADEKPRELKDENLEEALVTCDLTDYDGGDPVLDEEIAAMEWMDMSEAEEDTTADAVALLNQLMAYDESGDAEAMETIEEEGTIDPAVADSEEEMDEDEAETVDIPAVEIFSAGQWGDERYTRSDLDHIVANFNDLLNEIKPPVKLGHGSQKLLSASGLPAAGWITGLKRVGNKLVASLSDVPKQIARIIKNRGYKRVSVEIYSNYQDKASKRRGLVLKALALLGGDIPAVKDLKDVEALYASETDLAEPYKEITLMADLEREAKMDEEETSEEETEEEAPAEETEEEAEEEETPAEETPAKPAIPKEVTEMMAKQAKQLETQAKLIQQLVADNKAQKKAVAMTEHSRFLDEQIARGSFPPALKAKAQTLMTSLAESEDKVLTYAEGEEGDEVETTGLDLFMELIEGMPVVMEMGERAKGSGGRKPGGGGGKHEKDYKTSEDHEVVGLDIVDKVEKYMAEHEGVSMEDAMLAVYEED